MQVAEISVEKIFPYDRNPRINDSAVDKVASSLREFGFRQPIVVDEKMVIIAGHTRYKAAVKLGLTAVPVHIATGLSPEQVATYRLADNRSSQDASWDEDLLALEIGDLADAGVDLGLTAFDESELDRYLAMADASLEGETDPDEIPEAPENPVSILGDIWILGRHRLICGDCTDALVVKAVLGDVQPHLMVTDPPYGVEYDPDWRNRADRANGKAYGASAVGEVMNDEKADWREAWSLFPGDVAYVWHAGRYANIVQASLEANKFEIRSQIIWAKSRFAISRGDYHWQHEPCWYAVKNKKTGHWSGDRSQTTLWTISHNKSDTGHGTQKPVECMRRPIENNSSPGQAVYEPFSGSGTTIIAAEQTGRSCYAIELNPVYVDVAVKRWQDFTGKSAMREVDGISYNDAIGKLDAA